MSLEDNTQKKKEDTGFFTSLRNSFDKTAEDQSYNPVSWIYKGATGVYDYFAGDKEEGNKSLNTVDNNLGGYFSQIGGLASDDRVELSDSDKEDVKQIQHFQNTLSSNPFGTLGFTDNGPEYIQGNKDALDKELSNLDFTEAQKSFAEDNKDALSEYEKKIKASSKRILKEMIDSEIANNELANNETDIKRREFALKERALNEARKEHQEIYDKLFKAQSAYINIERDNIISKYIKPEEGKTAVDTFDNQYSTNISQRTEQYIMDKRVMPKVEQLKMQIDWDIDLTNENFEKIDNMIEKYKTTLIRDNKYRLEMLSVTKDPGEQAKMNSILGTQLEAREKLFRNQILEYVKLKKQGAKDEFFKIDDIEDTAFSNAYKTLTAEESSALLKRDGADTAASIYHDSVEIQKRFSQMIKASKDIDGITDIKDIGNTAKYFGLMVGNIVQDIGHGLGAALGVVTSGISSSTFKISDEDKVYYDEYELTSANDNIAQKGLKHLMYNVDDLGDAIGTFVVGNKIVPIGKAADKVIKGLDNIKLLTKGSGLVKQPIGYSTVKGLFIKAPLKAIAYGTRGLSESAIANSVIDKSMRISDTDYNAVLNVISDTGLEPVFRVGGKLGGKVASSNIGKTVSASIKINPLSDFLYKFMTGENTISDTVYKVSQELGISKADAADRVKKLSDIVYQSTDINVRKAYADNPQELADAIIKYGDTLKRNANEAGAHHMLTDEGNIITLKDSEYYKRKQGSEIDSIFANLNSSNSFNRSLGQKQLDAYKGKIIDTIKGDALIADGRITLNNRDLNREVNLFESRLQKLDSSNNVREDLTQIISELIDLRNSVYNVSGPLKDKIDLFDYVSNKSYSVDVEVLDKLGKANPEAYKELIRTGRVKISKGVSESTGLNEGVYQQQTDKFTSLSKELDNQGVYDSILQGLNKGADNLGYSFTAPKGMTDKQFQKILSSIFGKESLFNLTKASNRDIIAKKLINNDSLISIGYGKPGKKTIYYIGLGKKSSDKGFKLRYKDTAEYHNESSSVIKDILSQDSLENGVKLALPIHGINNASNFSPESAKKFLMSVMSNFKKELVIKEGKILKYTKKGKEIAKFINDNFAQINKLDSSMSRYVYEVFAVKVLDNFDLYKTVFADIQRIKDLQLKDGDVGADIDLNSLANLKLLIKSIMSDSSLKGAMREFSTQFDKTAYRKELEYKFNSQQEKAREYIRKAEAEIEEYKYQIRLGSSKKIVNQKIANRLEEIKNLKSLLTINKKDYINSNLDFIFKDSFIPFLRNNVMSSLRILDKLPLKEIKKADDIAQVSNKIKDIDVKIENNKVNKKRIIEEKIKLLKEKDTKKKDAISQKKQESLALYEESLVKIDKELSDLNTMKNSAKELKTLLEEKNKLEASLNKIESRFETDKVAIEKKYASLKMSNKLKSDTLKYSDLIKIIEENIDAFNKDNKLLDYFMYKLSDKFDEKGVKYNEDSIMFVRANALKRQVVDLLDGHRDYQESLIENPIEKIFSRALTGAKSTETALGDAALTNLNKRFTTDEPVENLQELYIKNEEFRNKIQSLKIHNKKDDGSLYLKGINDAVKKDRARVEKELKEILDVAMSGINFKLVEEGKVKYADGYSELLPLTMNVLLKKFKALNNISEGVRTLKTGEDGLGFPILNYSDTLGDEIIINKELKQNDNFDVLHIPKILNLKSLVISNKDGKEIKLSSIMYKEDKKIKKRKAGYYSGTDVYKLLRDVVNGVKTDPRIDVKVARESLGLKDGEYIMGTLGDKESYLHIYKGKNFEEALGEYYRYYVDTIGFKEGGNDLGAKTIGKREAPFASIERIFEDVDIPTTTYVLKEQPALDDLSIIDKIVGINKKGDTVPTEDWDRLSEQLREHDGWELSNLDSLGYTDKQKIDYVKNTYFNDLDDGTSFISEDLHNILSDISLGELSDKAKKAHAIGKQGDEVYQAKTLFNKAQVRDNEKYYTKSVFVGENSMKLGSYKKDSGTIYVNGRKYEIIGRRDGTNVQDFRNAKSDTLKIKDEYSFSRQGMNMMPYDIKNELLRLRNQQIDELVNNKLSTLGQFDDDISAFSEEAEWLRELYNSQGNLLSGDMLINGKLKSIYSGIIKLIDSYSIPSSNPTILKSITLNPKEGQSLKRNEIIIARDGKVHKNIIKTLKKDKKKLESINVELSKEEQDTLDFINYQLDNKDYFITSYRNPIPTRENLGVSRVRFAEDFAIKERGKNKVVKSNDVILHPEDTYIKKEGDNDGDTVVVAPISSYESSVIAKGALQYNIGEDLYTRLKEGNFENKIASVEQIGGGGKRHYKGIEIIEDKKIVNSAGKPGAIQLNNGKIFINPDLLKQKFDEKAWTKPYKQSDGSYVEALKEDQFSSYEEWVDFVLEHEYQHTQLTQEQFKKKTGDKFTSGLYKTEINRRALKLNDYELGLELMKARDNALEANTTVSSVMNISKVLNIFRQYTEELNALKGNPKDNENRIKEILDLPIYTEIKDGSKTVRNNYTIGNILKKLEDLGDTLKYDSTYSGKSGSAIQLVLDGAKSDLPEFPKEDWFNTLLEAVGVKSDEGKQFFFNEILTPIGLSIGKPLKKLDIAGMGQIYFKNTKLSSDLDFLGQSIGYQRDALEYFFKNHGLKLFNFQQNISKDFLMERTQDIIKVLNTRVDKGYKNLFSEVGKDSYISKKRAFDIENYFKQVRESTTGDIRDTLDEFDNIVNKYLPEGTDSGLKNHEKGKLVDMEKVAKEFFKSGVSSKKRLAALYSLSYKKNIIFNMMDEFSRIDYLNFNTFKTETRRGSGGSFGRQKSLKTLYRELEQDFSPIILLKDNQDADIGELKNIILEKKNKIKEKLDKVNASIDTINGINSFISNSRSEYNPIYTLGSLRINSLNMSKERVKRRIKFAKSVGNLFGGGLFDYTKKEINEPHNDIPDIIDDLGDADKVETTVIKEKLNEYKKDLIEQKGLLSKLFSEYKTLSKINKEKKKITKDTEELNSVGDYMDQLDIHTEFNGHVLKKINTDIKQANNIQTLLRTGASTKISDLLYEVDPKAINELNASRELASDIGYRIKEMHSKYRQELEKELKKTGLTNDEIVEQYKLYDGLVLASIKKEKASKSNAKYSSSEIRNKLFKNAKHEGLTGASPKKENTFKFNTEYYSLEVRKRIDKNKKYEGLTGEQKAILVKHGDRFITIYQDIINGLNKLNNYYEEIGGYNISKYSKRWTGNFVEDIVGSFVGDMQFYFRKEGIINKSDLSDPKLKHDAEKKQFIKHYKDAGSQLSNKRLEQIYNSVYTRIDNMLTKAVKQAQGAYYFGTYQTGSLLLGGMGHIAALTQIPGNALELLSYNKLDKTTRKEGEELIKEFNLYGENTALQGQGVDPYLADTIARKIQGKGSELLKEGTDVIYKKILKSLGVEKSEAHRRQVKNIIDTLVTEPLLAVDIINDASRRSVAINHVMRVYGFDNVDKFKEFFHSSVIKKDEIKALFYKKYNELGGGVISTSNIYRETILTGATSQAGILFQTMYRLLNGWGLHKISTMADKAIQLYKSAQLLRQGKISEAGILFKDFLDYFAAQTLNAGMAGGLVMKLDKYDMSQDNESSQSYLSNAKEMHNNYVALEIMFDRELSNLQTGSNFDIETQAAGTMIKLFKHMMRFLGPNPYVIMQTADNRQKTLDEGFLQSVYNATKESFSNYMRTRGGFEIGNIYGELGGQENISMLMYNVPSKLEEARRDRSRLNHFIAIDEVGSIAGVTDMLSAFVNPKYIGNDVMRKLTTGLLEDENIRNLSEYGISNVGYNLDKLLLVDGVRDKASIDEIYKKILTYKGIGTTFDEKGRKVVASKTYNGKMDDMITNLIAEIGYSKKDFINHPETRHEWLGKLMILLDQQNNNQIKIPHIISYMANNLYKTKIKEISNNNKHLPYSERITEGDKTNIKYDILKQYMNLGYLNLNKDNYSTILDMHINRFHGDKVKQLKKVNQMTAFRDYMNGLIIANQNLQEGDTDAGYLKTRMSRAIKGVGYVYNNGKRISLTGDNLEMQVDATLKIINTIHNSGQPLKEKNAKIAAALYGLDSAGWNVLRDNNVFNMLTLPSQRMLTSWLYKTNNEILDLDSNSPSNYQDNTGYKKQKYSDFFKRSFEPSSFNSGSRPGFSKQFPEMKKYMQGKSVPQNYNNIATNFTPKARYSLNELQFPLIKKINSYIIKELFRANLQSNAPKNLIKTRKGAVKTGRVRVKKNRAKLSRIKKARITQPTYHRRTTIKGLPSDIKVKAF